MDKQISEVLQVEDPVLFGVEDPVLLRDDLAEYAHVAWAGWMKYLFSKCFINRQGDCVIPRDAYKRWYRQMETSYDDLPENEKGSDREEADRMIDIFQAHL